jgi:NADH-quinone oxidoreductase subunit H
VSFAFPFDPVIRLLVLAAVVFNVVLVLTYVERKVLGHIQQRLGPMRTGFHGVLQAPADAIKLMFKEDLTPNTADRAVFQLAPFLVFVPIFMMFVTIPATAALVVRNLDLGLFYLVAFSSLHIVGLLMAGWGSDNKYALLGGVRSAAQLISYELPLAFAVMGIVLVTGTLNLREIVEGQDKYPYLLVQPLGALIFIIASLAEMGRTPFDIPMAESEVVGGPWVEYSGMRWAIFFLGEYASLFGSCALMVVLYLGGWMVPFLPADSPLSAPVGLLLFVLKTSALVFGVFWLRGTLPRLRIDQLMDFAWKMLIPFSLLNLVATAGLIVYKPELPVVASMGLALSFLFGYVVYLRTRRTA